LNNLFLAVTVDAKWKFWPKCTKHLLLSRTASLCFVVKINHYN
jgi:hypothetical protein